MRWRSFSGSLGFAAVAAAGFAPFALALRPILGGGWALATFAVLATAVYVAGLAATRRGGLGAALLALLVGSAALGVLWTPREVILAAALALGLCRSGVLYRAPFARAVALESLLLGGGLVLAAHLAGGGLLSGCLAVWGFFLAQSVFFLVAGVSTRRGSGEAEDPFDAARARLLAVLEEEP